MTSRRPPMGIALLAFALASCGEGGDAASSADAVAAPIPTVRAAHPLSRQVPVSGMDGTLRLEVDGLASLGEGANYEIWHVVGEDHVSGGVFDVNAAGDVVDARGEPGVELLAHDRSTGLVITIEAAPDPSAAPSGVEVLVGTTQADGRVQLTSPGTRRGTADEPSGVATMATPDG